MGGENFKRIFAALDTTYMDVALGICEAVEGKVGGVKLGNEFFTSLGPSGAQPVLDLGLPLFLDLKYHDIPNTVAGAVSAAMALRPFMLNVHAAGGAAMMAAAAKAADDAAEAAGCPRPLVLGVTVLTSLDEADLNAAGVGGSPLDQVKRLAGLAQKNGLNGVVCSGAEIEPLRAQCGPGFTLVVPGHWAAAGDQKRILTPGEAVARGADYLVIGRAITGADDPGQAAARIAAELDDAG